MDKKLRGKTVNVTYYDSIGTSNGTNAVTLKGVIYTGIEGLFATSYFAGFDNRIFIKLDNIIKIELAD